jgi:hypothetical protein
MMKKEIKEEKEDKEVIEITVSTDKEEDIREMIGKKVGNEEEEEVEEEEEEEEEMIETEVIDNKAKKLLTLINKLEKKQKINK